MIMSSPAFDMMQSDEAEIDEDFLLARSREGSV